MLLHPEYLSQKLDMLYFTPIMGATSTMERRLSLNQIAVPDDFPSDEFDAVSGKLGSTYGERYEYHAYIRDALNAIAYRFTALAEYDESLRSLINAPDGQPFRYMQERDLFGFYSNAHSVFDAFCFALFAVGALIDPGNFPLATEADERNVTWSTMLRAYVKSFPTDPILSELEKIWNDTEELRGIRNILTHRAVGARDLMATTDPSAPSDRIPRLNISLDAGTTRTHRSQVAGLLLLGLEAADKFVKAHGAG
jgi:hypothetical protein